MTKSELLDKIAAHNLRPPKEVRIMITAGCNLRCGHCWPESGPEALASPIPAGIINRMADELIQLGTEAICLTGGEPLSHPDWQGILRHLCGQPLLNSITLQTNATLLDEAKATALADMARPGLLIQVSLDGASAASHDLVRGQGAYARALAGLKRLCRAGLGGQVQAAFTEMRHNIRELPPLLEMAQELGIARLVSGTMVRQGRAKASPHMLQPGPEQYEELLDLYHSDEQFRERYDKLGNIAAIEWYKGRAYPSAAACTCLENPYIDARGRMFPCHYLPAPRFAAPGCHERSLLEVIDEALPSWATVPQLDRQRRKSLGQCRACPGKAHCAGGCTGRAFAASGDFSSVEDRCSLRKAVYNWPG